ncbi:MAG: hypothetical protein U9R34_02730, partial [Nanoarchaeota archaeon]|nr:hypothetical protein [Nanoarchaeota archaeon]
ISVIMLDTMGIYWTMKYPNEKDKELLGQWGMKGRGLNVQIFTPYGYYDQLKKKGVPTDFPFSIQPSELTPSDWCLTFGIDINSSQGVFIDRIIHELMESIGNFSIEDIIKTVEKDEKVDQVTRDGAINRFLTARGWGLFRKEGTKIEDLVKGGQITVLDVSCYAVTPGAEQLRALVIGLVSQKLFVQRMIQRKEEEFKDIKARTEYLTEEAEKKKKMPMVWLVIDECLPYSSKVQTEKGQKKIGDIVKEFSKGKKLNVIGYDSNTKKYGIYPVTKCYKRPQRQLLKFITETGQSITCTPDHKILSSRGFCEAQNSKDIALPLLMPYIEDKKPVEARLFGSILGEGWLSTNGKSIGFSGKGNNDDLEKIRCDLAYLGFKSSSIYSRKTKSKIHQSNGKIRDVKGTSHSITSSTKAYNHFRELGAPIGTKVLVPSKIPPWIMKGSKAIKCEFLAGLMGADGSIISRNINIPSDFNPIRFSFNKIKSLENNAFEFAEQLKKIYKDIGIKVSSIKKRSGNIRKDGNETIKIQMTIAKSLDNVIVYLENIGYRYCEKKEIEGKKWLAYLKHRNYIIKERNKLRIKALKIHKEQGIGKIRIGRILGLPDYVIREWIYYNGKAGMPKKSLSFREWTKNRVSGENLFVKIINKIKSKEEIVYDLSVGKVHNFVADGFVVHNCHEFLPNKGKTTASPALITILREGRQPGICLILATQQPGKIHTDVMTQSDIVLAHRLTAKIDVDSLGMLMQSYMREGLDTQIDNLPRVKGAVIAFDDMNERMYPLKIRPRITWHGGEAPSAMPRKKEHKFGL